MRVVGRCGARENALAVDAASLSRTGQNEVFFYSEEQTRLQGSGVGGWVKGWGAGRRVRDCSTLRPACPQEGWGPQVRGEKHFVLIDQQKQVIQPIIYPARNGS